MGRRSIIGRIAAAVLLIVFVTYIGFQVFANLNQRITTVDAMVVTVEDTISAEGVFVRSQNLVYGEAGKSAEYLVADGDKVSKGQAIVIYFGSGAAASSYQEISALNSKIDGLKYAQKNVSGGADVKKLDSFIYTEIQKIVSELSRGDAAKASKLYPSLQQLVVSRGANMTRSEEYQQQIDQLEGEKKQRQSGIEGSTTSVSASGSGYFFRSTDGYETVLTPQMLADITPDQLLSISEDEACFAADVAGTIVDSYEWYFATVVDKSAADRFKERAVMDIYFPQISGKSIRVSVYSVTTHGSRAVVIFKSGVMAEEYLDTRFQAIDMVVTTYTGIKVPREALRQEDGVWGVYCLDGAMSRFKPISWVYQTDSYVLVQPAKDSSNGLYMYDKIVVKGKDLEDGKVVR